MGILVGKPHARLSMTPAAPTTNAKTVTGTDTAKAVITLTPYRLLLVMRARHYLVWGFCILGTAVAIGISLRMPKLYTASAEVLLDFRESDPVQGQIQTPTLISSGYVATQADIVASDRVARKVVHALGLDTNPTSIQQWHEAGEGGTIDQYYMDALRKALEVRPTRLSNVLAIKYTSPSAVYAATVANAFAKAYVDTNVELKADPARDFKVWFDERITQARKKLEDAQARLSEFQQTKGIIIPSDEHIDMEITRLNELNTQLVAVQGAQADSQSRRDQAAGQMGDSPDVLQNGLVQSLRGDVARAQAKLDELARQYGRNHPTYINSEAELKTLQDKLDAEIHRVATSVDGSNSVNVQKERQIRAAVEAQKRHVLELRAQRDQATVLRNDVDSAQHAYDLVLQRLSTTNLESQVQQTNITILSEALPPVLKSSPHTTQNAFIGLTIGLMLGVLSAVLFEMRRPRLRSVDDVTSLLSAPVLVAVPHVRSGGPAGRRLRLPFPRWGRPFATRTA
jgi:chain length determinant protein EpsF